MTLWQLGRPFSTYDKDYSITPNGYSCAAVYGGAWWYGYSPSCHQSNLNGHYYGGPHTSFGDGVEWSTWTGYQYSLKTTEMKIRPV